MVSISGFGQDGPYREAAGLRPDRAGHGRADVDHGPAGPGPGARRHSRSPISAPAFSARMAILVALLEREVSGEGQWVQSSLLGAQISHAGFPGGALADRRRRAGAGRQRPSDQHSDRRVPDQRRPHQHRRRRQAHLHALLPDARASSICSTIPDLPTTRRAPKIATAINAEHRRGHKAAARARADRRSSTRPACRAARSTRWTRCLPTRRCSISAWPRRCTMRRSAISQVVNQPVKLEPHAEPDRAMRRPKRASTPRKC